MIDDMLLEFLLLFNFEHFLSLKFILMSLISDLTKD